MDRFSGRVGVASPGIVVRDSAHLWGSCGKGGKLYFHWRSILLPPSIVEYVVVHELVHLHEPHHTPAFWTRVERVGLRVAASPSITLRGFCMVIQSDPRSIRCLGARSSERSQMRSFIKTWSPHIASFFAIVISGVTLWLHFHDRATTEAEWMTRIRCEEYGTRPAVQNFSGSKSVTLSGITVWTFYDHPDLKGQQGTGGLVGGVTLAPLKRYEVQDEVLHHDHIPAEYVVGYGIAFDVISEGFPRPVSVQCTYRLMPEVSPSGQREVRLMVEDVWMLDPDDPMPAGESYGGQYIEPWEPKVRSGGIRMRPVPGINKRRRVLE